MDQAPPQIKKLETSESLAILHEPAAGSSESLSAATSDRVDASKDPLAIRVAVKRGRLVLLTAATLVVVLALTLCFSRRGVVIETFERRALPIADQEKLLERYNSYSGTITALIERPVEMYVALVLPVVVLRVMAQDAVVTATRWRLVILAVGAGGSYLLANAFSAVNVQVRELPIQPVILAGELNAQTVDPETVSTVDKSFVETRPQNPSTNTFLRNLLLPRAIASRGTCADRDSIVGIDSVDYLIPQLPWMKYLLPAALEPTNTMKFDISAKNTPANAALTPDQFPMNASLAADLVIASDLTGDTWGSGSHLYDYSLADQYFREDNKTGYRLFGPTARLTGLLPPKLGTIELEDRAWFLKNAGPTLYNISDEKAVYKNASLLSWTMEFARVDIVPGAVWVDAMTVEREIAMPQMVTNTSKDGKTRYLAYPFNSRADSPNHLPFVKFDGVEDAEIILYKVCTDRDGFEAFTSSTDGKEYAFIECPTQSKRSLFLVSRGKRLIADALIRNATVSNSEVVAGGKDDAVVVNLRMVVTTTAARITSAVQDLSTIFKARCDATDGCMGFDVPLPGSGQRLVVNGSTLPVGLAPPWVDTVTKRGVAPLTLVSARRPSSFSPYKRPSEPEVIGDILLPHNIRNMTMVTTPPSDCDSTARSRVVAYVNNHVYMETTLQATYTAAAFFLFQNGVVRDVVNQSATTHTVLAFNGNIQEVDVYVYIPWLNVVLTVAGCALLAVTIAVVVLWPYLRKSDPLERITGPHAIASVMLNESAYPSLLLTRAVADSGETAGRDNADKFVIQSLSLQRDDAHQTI